MASASTSSSASAITSISASAPPREYGYEVFLNHRGTDVKKTFVSHLYKRLLSSGLKVFLDQPEMERGEDIEAQIKGAIKTASVNVAIFSPRYAESRWCLDELVQMLSNPDATTIPVFYHVKPADLRWTDKGKCIDRLCAQALRFCCRPSTENLYAEALLSHQKKGRYTPKRIADWKKALSDASSLSGFELDAYNGDEGQLLDAVAQQVMKKARNAPLHVAEHPTGLDEKLLEFARIVSLEEQHNREGPNLVGIVGPGGVGKTTLAKLFFNTKKSNYQRSCFLAEVREAAATGTLPSHQRKLYQDLTGSDPPICSSTDEGIPILKRLRSSQALIILDDVDGLEQLEALFLPIKDVLPAGSLILLTTRNKDVLTKHARLEESNIYNMTGLNLEHSQELFCWHAFQQPYPVVGYENLVREFLNLCQGLPLSLKVIGSELYAESRQYWEAQLRKLSQVVPPEIQNTLKISYDSLDKEVKKYS